MSVWWRGYPPNFNPPTPWGVGLVELLNTLMPELFQSTHPVGGGTHRLAGLVV